MIANMEGAAPNDVTGGNRFLAELRAELYFFQNKPT